MEAKERLQHMFRARTIYSTKAMSPKRHKHKEEWHLCTSQGCALLLRKLGFFEHNKRVVRDAKIERYFS